MMYKNIESDKEKLENEKNELQKSIDKIKEQKEKANNALYILVLSVVFPVADCGVDRRQELGGGVTG